MRDYGKITTSLWASSAKFRSLDDDRWRLFYLYLHTCPHVTSCGAFVLPTGYATEDLQWDREMVEKAIDSLSIAYLIAYDRAERLVRIVGFFEHDAPTNEKHAKGVIRTALALPDCREKLNVLKDLARNEYAAGSADLIEAIESLSKAYRNPEPLPEPEPLPHRYALGEASPARRPSPRCDGADDGLEFLDGAESPPVAEPPPLVLTAPVESESPPQADIPEPAASPPAPRAKRGSRLPDDWTLPADWEAWARSEGHASPIRAAAVFADYWRAQPGQKGVKADWMATWRNWIRRDIDNGHHNRPGPAGSPPDRQGSPEQRDRLRAGLATVLAPELDARPAGPGQP